MKHTLLAFALFLAVLTGCIWHHVATTVYVCQSMHPGDHSCRVAVEQ